MQDDRVCPQEGHEPYTPSDDEIKESVEEFDVLTDPHYDDDYIDMHSTYYRDLIRVYKWFKEEYDRYKACSKTYFRKIGFLEERVKWLEIEKAELESQLSDNKNIEGSCMDSSSLAESMQDRYKEW